MGKHNEFGNLGEQLAADFLRENGYLIRERNYRYLKGEVDIIAQRKEVLAIVEVKSRSSEFLEDISDTINTKKIKLLIEVADNYVLEKDLEVDVRFDIITILKKGNEFEIEHIEDSFSHF